MNGNISDVKNAYRVSVIIGVAMAASVFIYAAVVEIMKRQGSLPQPTTPAEPANLLRYIFLGISLLEIFLIILLKRILLSGKAIKPASPAQPETFKGLASSGILSQVGWQRKRINFPGPFQPLMTSAIIGYALCESVAIFGLVLFFLTQKSLDFYLFLGLSLTLFAVFFPRLSQWEEWLKQREVDAMAEQKNRD